MLGMVLSHLHTLFLTTALAASLLSPTVQITEDFDCLGATVFASPGKLPETQVLQITPDLVS